MAAAVESMAYANEVPWHGLGVKVSDDLTPKQMMKAAKLDWRVEKRPLGLLVPGKEENEREWQGQVVPGKFGLTRTTDNKVLSIVGSMYKPVQNEQAFDFFKKFTEAGHMKMETAGSLQDGKYVWALAKVDQSFNVGRGDDKVEGYLLLMSPFEANKALVAQFTSVRVVCWNTLNMALGAGLKGTGKRVFRMPHVQLFDETIKAKAEEALGISTQHVQEFKLTANFLAKTRITDEQVHEFFFRVAKITPDKAVKLKEEDKLPKLIERLDHALVSAPGANLASSKGTWWGALNAVTYVVDHELGRTRDTGLYRAWLGSGAEMKRAALNLAVEEAKKAA